MAKKKKRKKSNSVSSVSGGTASGAKRKIIILVTTVCVLALAGMITLIAILTSDSVRTDKMISRAEEYLLSNPHKIVLSELRGSTDENISESINSGSSMISGTVDGSDFCFVETLGEGKVSYLCIGDSLYIDESVINLCTKSQMTEEQKKELKDRYITVFTAEDYSDRDIEKLDDGSVIITLKGLSEERISELESEIEDNDSSEVSIGLDRDETKVVIIMDSEGRYVSIEKLNAFYVNYDDGYSALITMMAKKEYSYDKVETLTVPSGTYVDSSNGYRDLFATPFEVTTNVVTSTNNSEILNRLYSISPVFGSIGHSILRVEKNNYELTYPNTNEPDEGETLADGTTQIFTLVDNMLYSNYTTAVNGAQSSEKLKQEIDEEMRKYYYRNDVINNLFPAYARDFLNITSEYENGVTTVTCEGINEEIYNALNNAVNYVYLQTSQILLTPKVDECKYVVKFDDNGAFLSTQLTVVVSVLGLDGMEYADEWIVVERSFDYDKADEYYDSHGSAFGWISKPSDADEYINSTNW